MHFQFGIHDSSRTNTIENDVTCLKKFQHDFLKNVAIQKFLNNYNF